MKQSATIGLVTLLMASSAWAVWSLGQPPKKDMIGATFAPFSPGVSIRRDTKNFYVESNGIPNHPLMVGITAWQQQVPIPQPYKGSNAWQIPLLPVPAKQPLSARDNFFRGAIAIAANGVPIFNPIKNDGQTDTFLAGELDAYGGHAGQADDYHYHIAPLHLQTKLGSNTPIGYALDGYPLVGLTELTGAEPSGLDTFNGHTDGDLGYHYHATKTYPYINGGFHGNVTQIGGQVDPQPRSIGVRPATTPLRGAKITAASQPAPGQYTLTYTVNGETKTIGYAIESDGSYLFTYGDGAGNKVTEYFQPQRDPSKQRPRPRENPNQLNLENLDGGVNSPLPSNRNIKQWNPPAVPEPKSPPSTLRLTSGDVASDGMLPAKFTCDGEGISPSLQWTGVPAGTKSFALAMHHVPRDGETHVYWVLANIPLNINSIPQNGKGVGVPGANTVNRGLGYAPPCSKGPGQKSYYITLYALRNSWKPTPNETLTRDSMLAGIRNSVLGTAKLEVIYTRGKAE